MKGASRTVIVLTVVGGVTAALAGARRPEPAPTPGGPLTAPHASLTLEGAERVLDAAAAEAGRLNAHGAIAVVDEGGHLIALRRLDGTFAAGTEVSTGKARTAALFHKPTRAFEESIKGGRAALLGVEQLTPLIGGVPIEVDGVLVGAVGVSGAHSQDEDERIALAGAAAVASPAGPH